ncbi:MAG: DUF4062 domain-containing protein [Acidobacteriota bacterium]
MARPRVFVSSTYYDLKHLRSSLENFIESLGFDAILSEKGKIAYTPDIPLDESCYREVGTADIFVLIIGGRYGSEASGSKAIMPKDFYARYNSITREEYKSAVKKEISLYVLIEKSVQAEYETYLKNKKTKDIVYAHVDSVNIFELIEDILSQPRNNPVQQFEKYTEIELWLREQWAGLFRELLQRMQAQKQLASLQAEVSQLSELNTTFKRYLEEIVSRISPKETSVRLIRTETNRLRAAAMDRLIVGNPLTTHLIRRLGVPIHSVRLALRSTRSFEAFLERLRRAVADPEVNLEIQRLSASTRAEEDYALLHNPADIAAAEHEADEAERASKKSRGSKKAPSKRLP